MTLGAVPTTALVSAPALDSGADPIGAASTLPGTVPEGAWLRLRGMGNLSVLQPASVAAAQRLVDARLRPVAFLRWNGTSWTSPRRGGKAGHIPTDLREAFARARDYARAYGPAMSAWEIDNEPDLGWAPENAETFAAFHKAVYLGLQAGARDRGLSQAAPVLSTPPGLPPGRFFASLGANGYLSYIDAFNYHYYGYAKDFSGVYRVWEAAVTGRDGPVGGGREEPVEVGSLSGRGGTYGTRAGEAVDGGQGAEDSGQGTVVGGQRTVGGGRKAVGGGQGAEDSGRVASLVTRRLPVFLTEYGYGLLSPEARLTAAGRVRQWRWFRTVGEQVRELRIEGPMAFYLPPYLEYNLNEFGLTVADNSGWARVWGAARERIPGKPVVGSPPPLKDGPVFVAGHLWFTPDDFGATKAEPWMAGIGARVGRYEATPALAWLLDQAKQPYEARPWELQVPEPSPVVIDLVAGPEARALKSWGGYLLTGSGGREAPVEVGSLSLRVGTEGAVGGSTPVLRAKSSALEAAPAGSAERVGSRQLPASTSTGKGDAAVSLASAELRLYNFGDTPVSGRLVLEAEDGAAIRPEEIVDGGPRAEGGGRRTEDGGRRTEDSGRREEDGGVSHQSKIENPKSKILSLAPGEVRSVRVTLCVAADRYVARTVTVRFLPDGGGPVSVFSTRLIPDATGMTPTVVQRFDHPVDAAKEARSFLLTRPLAAEEPRLQRQGESRWLVSKGTRIEDWGKVWRVVVTALPDEPVRPAMVELPLPPNFKWPMTALMRLSYRMTVGVDREPYNAAALDILFRTRNGNLYAVLPRVWAEKEWRHYAEPLENFGLFFFGRAEMPWRIADNEPVALAIFLRPKTLPATFEFANAEITSFAR